MNILLIITPYNPAQSPNTLRWVPLVKLLEDKGHTVTILTSKWSSQKTSAYNDSIHRVGHNTLSDYLSDKRSSKQRRGETGHISNTQLSPIKKLSEWIIDKTWRKRYWPDGSVLFLKPGIQKGSQLVNEKSITHIISVGLPFTCHLIAQKLKEKHPSLHWHMDIEDPFSYSKEFWVNNFKRYATKNHQAEATAFLLADSINVTNHRAKEKYDRLFAESKTKTEVIPPLFAAYDETKNVELILSRNKIHLAFFGTFYRGVRSPETFLIFLKRLKKYNPSLLSRLQFHFFGSQNTFSTPIFYRYRELKPYLIFHGFVNRDHAISAMKQVDILINFGNTTDYHLPSKVVDYLYVNKPILNLISTPNDSSKVFFENYDDILNLDCNRVGEEIIRSFSEFVLKKREPASCNKKSVSPYNTEAIGSMYLNALGQI